MRVNRSVTQPPDPEERGASLRVPQELAALLGRREPSKFGDAAMSAATWKRAVNWELAVSSGILILDFTLNNSKLCKDVSTCSIHAICCR